MVPVYEPKELKTLLLFDLGLLFQQGSDWDDVGTVLVSIDHIVTSNCFTTDVPIDMVNTLLFDQVVLVTSGEWLSGIIFLERGNLLLPSVTVSGDIERHAWGNLEGTSINGDRVDFLLPELSV